MSEYLFSYGTLQNEKVQIDLFGRRMAGWTDALPGYKLIDIEIKDEHFLSRGENKNQKTLVSSEENNDFVKGTVFEISGEELLLADNYEPDNYSRIEVLLQSGRKAWIYIAL